MKTSIFLTSFFSTNWSGSNPLTSPAICVAKAVASDLVIVPTPLLPAMSPCQFASVPIPSDDTRPMPVTTTRLFTICLRARSSNGLLLGFRVGVDVFDRLLHARDLLGILIGNLDAELLFEGHDQFDGVERV